MVHLHFKAGKNGGWGRENWNDVFPTFYIQRVQKYLQENILSFGNQNS